MNIDAFLVRIVFLVIPGFAGYKTFRTVQSTGKSRKQIKDWQDFISILLLSILSYVLLILVHGIILFVARKCGYANLVLTVKSLDAMTQQTAIDYLEIGYATILSIIVGLVSGIFYNRKIVFKVARFFRITKHYGDDDVWSYVMNSDDVKWLFVRDHKVGLVYYGALSVFSESDDKRELLLDDVDVFSNADGKKLYHIDSLYICRDDNELTLEVPNQKE
jgi:hypothetical protein